MTNQQIVEEIVINVLKKLEILSNKKEKEKLLVIHQQTDQSRKQIEELEGHWQVIDIDYTETEIPCEVNRVVFLEVNQDLFVKAALGIVDTRESLLFSKSVILGLTIDFVFDETFSMVLYHSINLKMNSKYVELLLGYQSQLNDYGVQFSNIQNILPVENSNSLPKGNIINFNERLLTKEIIEGWGKGEICIHPQTIVTPLARDVAKEKGIEICVIEIKGGVDS